MYEEGLEKDLWILLAMVDQSSRCLIFGLNVIDSVSYITQDFFHSIGNSEVGVR